MTTTTLSTLESHLWEAANILRGSPVDRTDWKSYILPLMFFKHICDVWDEEFEEAVKTYEKKHQRLSLSNISARLAAFMDCFPLL
jgi:type I restriction-modification system DNA methylase subunit